MDTDADLSMETSLLGPFPSLWKEPIRLFPADEIHDDPRKIEECSVEPGGKLAAAVDSLGRVLLIDLSTKQIARIFKGYRDASVYWLHSDRRGSLTRQHLNNPRLNLVLHSRQRRTIEIYRMRCGAMARAIQTDRGAQVIPCVIMTGSSLGRASALHLRSQWTGTSLNYMDEIRMDQTDVISAEVGLAQSLSQPHVNPSRRSITHRLQHLRQLLSADAVQFGADDVMQAMKSITSLADLSIALDLLSVSVSLEDKLCLQGSAFHLQTLNHCRRALSETVGNSPMGLNPEAKQLSLKIQYHAQVRRLVVRTAQRRSFLYLTSDVFFSFDPSSWSMRTT